MEDRATILLNIFIQSSLIFQKVHAKYPEFPQILTLL